MQMQMQCGPLSILVFFSSPSVHLLLLLLLCYSRCAAPRLQPLSTPSLTNSNADRNGRGETRPKHALDPRLLSFVTLHICANSCDLF